MGERGRAKNPRNRAKAHAARVEFVRKRPRAGLQRARLPPVQAAEGAAGRHAPGLQSGKWRNRIPPETRISKSFICPA